jgi:hypothetical protein
MRYLTSAVKVWVDEDRELRASAQLALHTHDAKRFARESQALRHVLQHAEPGTSYVLHVRNTGEALLVKQ